MVIHQETEKALKAKGFNPDNTVAGEMANTHNFRRFMEIHEAETEAQGKAPEITEYIDNVYRVLHKGKEYVYYHCRRYFETKIGATIECYVPHVGKYEMPRFRTTVTPKATRTGNWTYEKKSELDGAETRYELEWNKKTLAKINKNFTENTRFYIIYGLFRSTISEEEFENHDRKTILSNNNFIGKKNAVDDLLAAAKSLTRESITRVQPPVGESPDGNSE